LPPSQSFSRHGSDRIDSGLEQSQDHFVDCLGIDIHRTSLKYQFSLTTPSPAWVNTSQACHPCSDIKPLDVSQIVLALSHTPFIARLIFCAYQAVRTTDPTRRTIQIATVLPDGTLDVTAEVLGRL
jgi:hypothetical protein